jgi:light-harvesting complex I chlorophyll a/b binding protein 5
MMAVAGILGQELLGVTPEWWNAGAKDYGVPMAPLTAMEFLIMGFLETKRYQGFKETGTVCAKHHQQQQRAFVWT